MLHLEVISKSDIIIDYSILKRWLSIIRDGIYFQLDSDSIFKKIMTSVSFILRKPFTKQKWSIIQGSTQF